VKLTILGSGTTFTTKQRNAPGYILEIGQDRVLLDAGEGTKKRIIEAGFDIYNISHIFITHFHIDHINEIPAILWDFSGQRQGKNLYFYGPPGFKKLFKEWTNLLFPGLLAKKFFKVIIKECGKDSFNLKDVRIKTEPGDKHGLVKYQNSVFFRFEHQNKSFVYAGDVHYDYPKELIAISQNADVLLIESANPDQKKVADHLTPSQAGKIATEAGVKKLVLTHFYPTCEKYDLKKQAQKTYKGPIVLAKDLMDIKI